MTWRLKELGISTWCLAAGTGSVELEPMMGPRGVCVGYGEVGAPGRDRLDPMIGPRGVCVGYGEDGAPGWDCGD